MIMLRGFSFFSNILQILRRCGGSVELVDVSHELPQLIRRPGLKKWKACVFLVNFFVELPNLNNNDNATSIE